MAVLGVAAVVTTASAASLVGYRDAGDGPRAVMISPVVPPSGGFAVAARDMDETLRDLVAATGSRTARPAPGGEQVLVDGAAGSLHRAVQTGAVMLETRRGPALVRVDVRRSSTPCAPASCVRVVHSPGGGGRPPSTLAVVVDDGVEVRAEAWAGSGGRATSPASGPPLTMLALVSLAGDPVWREPDR
ncbi:hypothetical protein [Nocardioides rubriscoriae]|uniref:hypothetical protein n=1 Tax=Nocardioides rubriscoriae TaxID=642762 RepID=UPI0011E010C9|nr:hypothetical protein [Nocardioides rubriscoriae]